MESVDKTVRRELYSVTFSDAACVPFLSGAIRGCGEISFTKNGFELSFSAREKSFIDLVCDVIERIFRYKPEKTVGDVDGAPLFCASLPAKEAAPIFEKCGIVRDKYTLIDCVPKELVSSERMRRAYLAGLFLSCGTLKTPEKTEVFGEASRSKGYLLCFNLNSDMVKEDVVKLISSLPHIEKGRVQTRKKGSGVFLKSGEAIGVVLAYLEASEATLRLYEIMAERRMNNDLNRAQNFDLANIGKKVRTAAEQIAAIKKLMSSDVWQTLGDDLRETCRLRLENESAGLEEIAAMSSPPVTKSCVNHRMRKIMRLAERN